MDQGLKERLVGAAVLIAIAVWLIPWVLDGPEEPLETNGSSLQLPAGEEPMPMRTQTLRLGEPESQAEPEAPPTPATAAAAPPPASESDSEPESSAGEAAAPTETPAVAAARTEPARTPPSAAQPEARPAAAAATAPKPAAAVGDWTVQLGSFGEEANARRLAQRAGTFGYKPEVTTTRSGGRTLYRVRVGPQRTRAEADATASALKAHGLPASVVAAR
jgi:DedD protein